MLIVKQVDRRTGGPGGRTHSALLSTCLAVSLSAWACAKMGAPPGGPPDAIAPSIISTRPDSIGVYPDFKGNAEFVFDETVSEGTSPDLGYGNGDLERMVVLSPTDKVPHVSWERSRITVRPREGWRPNTVYRIELLPGVADLRRNHDRHGAVITFTTGAPLPTDSLSGIAIDWTTRQPARLAVIEALLLPDSLPYETQSDSNGRFVLAPLPHAAYELRGFLDQNRNRRLDGKENWDTVAVSPAPAASSVLWLAPRDTAGPRVMQVTVRDSVTVEIQVTQPLDPYQALDSSHVVVRMLPDSTIVAVRSFRAKALDDSLDARARLVADSLRTDSLRRSRPDTGQRHAAPVTPRVEPARPPAAPVQQAPRGRRGARPPAPVDSVVLKLAQTRPALDDRLVLRLFAPLPPESKYTVEVRGIRNVSGAASNAVGGFTVPKARVLPDSTGKDSTSTPRPDSLPARPKRLRASRDTT